MSTFDYPTIVNTIVTGTSTEASESRKLLEKAFADEPGNYFDQLFTLMSKADSTSIRKFCCNNLTKSFTFFSETETKPQSKLTKENIARFKSEIFDVLSSETTREVKIEISKLLGELAAGMMSDPKTGGAKSWPEFTTKTMDLVKSDDVTKKVDGNIVLGTYFLFGDEDYSSLAYEIKGYINRALSHSNPVLVHSGMLLLSGYVSSLDHKDSKQFNEFTGKLLECFVTFTKKDDPIKEIFQVDLIEYIKECPKMFETSVNKFYKDVKAVLDDKKCSKEAKEAVLDLFIGMNLQHPKKLEKALKDTMNLITQFFVDYIEEADDEWKNPTKHVEDGQLEAVFKRCVNFYDMILSSVNPEISLPILKTQLTEAYKNKDWKKKAASLACLSQIGEYCEDLTQLNPYIQIALLLLEDEHPKVRYTVLHLLGQIAEDRSDDFAETFHHIVGDISKRLNDPVPRVVSHVFACLTNIVENCEQKHLETHIKKILPACFKYIKEGPWAVKETAIPVIAAFCESCKDLVGPYYKEASELLLHTLENETGENVDQIKAECLEALSLFAMAVGKTESKDVCEKIVNFMAQILAAEATALTKTPYKSYIFSAIPRVQLAIKEDFEPYLEKLVPNLITVTINLQVVFSKLADNIEKEEDSSQLSDEFTLLLNTYKQLFTDFPKYMIPHIDTINDFARGLQSDASNEITEGALDLLPALFKAIKLHGNDESKTVKYLNDFLKMLTDILKSSLETDLLAAAADNIEALLEEGGLLLKEQAIEELINLVLSIMKQSCVRIEAMAGESTAPPGEDDEDEMEDNDEQAEWDLQLSLCSVIGKLYKTQPHACILLAKSIFQSVIPNYLNPKQSDDSKLVGVFMMVDLVENMGYNFMKNEYPQLVDGFIYFAVSPFNQTRQASLYALGLVAKTSGDFFKTAGAKIITAVINGIENNEGDDGELKDSARDNGISALGKILKYQAETISDYKTMFEMWVNYLPLKVDYQEGVETYEFLIDTILGENASMVFGADGSRISKVLGIFADNLDTNFTNDDIKGKVVKMMEILLGNETYKEVVEKAIKKLTAKQQEKLGNVSPKN